MHRPLFQWLMPRLVSLTWSVWLAATALAYVDGPPTTLEATQEVLPMPIWTVWSFCAVSCLAGSLVPPHDNYTVQRAGVLLRGAGLAVAAGMLTLWGIEFIFGSMDRGWVSGKNYWLLSLGAIASGWYVGRGGGRPSIGAANV